MSQLTSKESLELQRRLEEMAAEQRGLREQQSRLEGEVAALRAQRLQGEHWLLLGGLR